MQLDSEEEPHASQPAHANVDVTVAADVAVDGTKVLKTVAGSQRARLKDRREGQARNKGNKIVG